MGNSINIYKQMGSNIMSGILKPNQKITEQALAEEFGTSRGPVREALRRLESRNLISYTPNAGARIISFTLKQAQDLLDVRLVLECTAVEKAVENASDEEINNISDLLDNHELNIQKQADGNYIDQNANNDFHIAIIKAGHNRYIEEILLDELYIRLQVCRHQHSWGSNRAESALNEHRQICESIANRDSQMANLRMRRHLEISHKNILETIKNSTNKNI